jgi:hypothetical protein
MLGFAVMLTWALTFALGPVWGLSTLILCLVLMSTVVFITVMTITVTQDHIRIDRACLPTSFVVGVQTLTETQMRDALRTPPGPIFMAVRPWACREGILVQLNDPTDPHTHWLMSSRHRERLAEAILAATSEERHDRLVPGKEV